MGKTHLVSRREASMMLGVAPATIEPLLRKNGLALHQIPNHTRKYYVRSEVERLVIASEMGSLIGSRTAQANDQGVSL
jgi:hypothetical protein